MKDIAQISLFPTEEGSFISLVQETWIFLEIQKQTSMCLQY